jgi:hypothetical protein
MLDHSSIAKLAPRSQLRAIAAASAPLQHLCRLSEPKTSLVRGISAVQQRRYRLSGEARSSWVKVRSQLRSCASLAAVRESPANAPSPMCGGGSGCTVWTSWTDVSRSGRLLPMWRRLEDAQHLRVKLCQFLVQHAGAFARRHRLRLPLLVQWPCSTLRSSLIDVFICKLRKKLSPACGGANYSETVWGRGYVLGDPAEETQSFPLAA